MNTQIKELVAIGASVAAHCQPCLEYHVQAAIELGVTENDIRQAVEIGQGVEKGAMSSMQEFSAATLTELCGAANQDSQAKTDQTGAIPGATPEVAVLKIFDPAMCCSSGVCGPEVDPTLAQFAGALKAVAAVPGVRVERYNLGQEPQAFVDYPAARSLLADGGDKRLPFIFINDRLWVQGRYPSREELLQALDIKNAPAPLPGGKPGPGAAPCCGEGGCC